MEHLEDDTTQFDSTPFPEKEVLKDESIPSEPVSVPAEMPKDRSFQLDSAETTTEVLEDTTAPFDSSPLPKEEVLKDESVPAERAPLPTEILRDESVPAESAPVPTEILRDESVPSESAPVSTEILRDESVPSDSIEMTAETLKDDTIHSDAAPVLEDKSLPEHQIPVLPVAAVCEFYRRLRDFRNRQA